MNRPIDAMPLTTSYGKVRASSCCAETGATTSRAKSFTVAASSAYSSGSSAVMVGVAVGDSVMLLSFDVVVRVGCGDEYELTPSAGDLFAGCHQQLDGACNG